MTDKFLDWLSLRILLFWPVKWAYTRNNKVIEEMSDEPDDVIYEEEGWFL